MKRRRTGIVGLLLLALMGGPLSAEEETLARIVLPEGEWIDATGAIEIRWTRPLTVDDGRIAVFLGQSDVTDLFVSVPEGLRYDAASVPLPPGRQDLIVWLVPPQGEWRELERASVAIRTRLGFETAEVKPSIDISGRGQIHEKARPEENLSPRGNHADATMQLGLRSDHQRRLWALQSDVRATGVTYEPEALRFQTRGSDAPRVDLASYSLQFGREQARLSVGNVSFGTHRHLISGFGSRGLVLDLPLGSVVTLRLGAMNGTSIVGWNNLVGLAEDDHMMLGAALAFELIPSRPGGLMAEISWLDGSIQPFDHFNQGSIRSAETSSGLGLRLAASSPSQRFTVETGYTFSRFRDAFDPELDAGLDVLEVDDARRGAVYLDSSVVLIQGRPLTERHQLNLTAGYRFERVEPLYRSVGTFVQSDLERNAIDLTGNAGPFLAQLGLSTLQDNLDGLRSVLRTKTRQAQLNLGLQIGAFLGESARAGWLPVLTVSLDRIHQYGAWLPDNPEFAASHVPDQVSENASAAIEWSVGRTSFGYRWNDSSQDNRQPGRELADSRAGTHGLFWGIALADRVSIQLDLGRDSFENQEIGREDTTDRGGVTFNWRLFGQTSLATSVTQTRASDSLDEQRSRAYDLWAEIASGFPLSRAQASARNARVFLRLADRESKSRNLVFGFDEEQRGLTVTTGVNLSIQ